MLSKIIGIRNIGRLDSKAAVELRKLTLIYGDNGRGKTTLSAILRSLALGDANHILERRTLLSPDEPSVILKSDSSSSPLAFKNGAWSTTLPHLEVFDARFVTDNVYAGSAVEHEHKRQLHEFVMGAEGVAFARAVDACDATIRAINLELQASEARIRLRFDDAKILGLDLAQILGLPHDANVAARIEEQRQRVEAARSIKELTSKSGLGVPTLPPLDIADLEALLVLDVSDVAAGAEAMTRKHADRCLGTGGRDWLAAGVQYLNARTVAREAGQAGCGISPDDDSIELCPFCKADITNNSLVVAYRSYFSESFRQLTERLATAAGNLQSIFSDAVRANARHVIEQNALLAEWWKKYGVEVEGGLDVESLLAAHKTLGACLSSRLQAKRAAPLESFGLGSDELSAAQAYDNLLAELTRYGAAITSANLTIERVKATAGTANLGEEERRYWELVCQQRRHDPLIDEECEQHTALLVKKREAESAKQSARAGLDTYAATVFSKYQVSINQHLQKCGCGYSIGGTKVSYTGGKPSADYHLTITNTTIPLAPSKKDPLAPSFRTTLSEGDKSTLAFAFFLARLDLDQQLADRIVVFDDPITSQDSHRRAWTRKQILRIAGTCKQVIVLTHDAQFARQLWEDARIECHTLHLERDGERSVIVPWNIERATESDYFRHHRTLSEYVAAGAKGHDLRIIAQSIRPMLEANLRMRFPEDFSHGEWLGGFLKKVREADDGHPLVAMQSQLEELEDIGSFSNRYHHDQNPGWAAEPVADGEIHAYARRALIVARGAPVPS